MAAAVPPGSAREVFAVALQLGLTSFGGLVAHPRGFPTVSRPQCKHA